MPEVTPHIGLKKPLGSETADISVINDNMDMIDSALGDLSAVPTATKDAAGAITELFEAIENADIPDATLTTKGKVQLSSATNSTAEDQAATPKAVKDAMDAAAGASGSLNSHVAATNVHGATSAATASRLIIRDATGRAKVAAPASSDDIARLDSITKAQAGLGSVDNYGTATQAEAEAGVVANKFMTPQRTKQAIDKFTGGVPFRVNAGALEFYDGTGWKTVGNIQVGRPRRLTTGNISLAYPTYSTVLEISNVKGRLQLARAVAVSGGIPYLRVTIDGKVEEFSGGSQGADFLVQQTSGSNPNPVPTSEPIYFYKSLKVEMSVSTGGWYVNADVVYALELGSP